MAHNGGFGELARLDRQLGSYRSLVGGDTDSERFFALITQQADAQGGDLGAGMAAAARWIAARLPVSSLNTVIAAPGELWALRYPGQHALHILRAAGPGVDRPRRTARAQRDLLDTRPRAGCRRVGGHRVRAARRGERLAHARPR